MLDRILALTRRPPPDPLVELDEQLEELEAEIRSLSDDRQRGQLLNRAGDLCVRAKHPERALRYFGGAIDAFLETGFYDAAAATCRKVIRIAPDVVRARCTLAFLTLGEELPSLPAAGLVSEAHHAIAEYVAAARAAETEALCIKRLRLMSGATENPEIRQAIGMYLLELGDEAGADRVLGEVNEERNELRPRDHSEQRERWAQVLRVSIIGAWDGAKVVRRSVNGGH
ncbi:hypothetical protein BH20GEM2_BH20GEM2_03480 [soil metagenome]